MIVEGIINQIICNSKYQGKNSYSYIIIPLIITVHILNSLIIMSIKHNGRIRMLIRETEKWSFSALTFVFKHIMQIYFFIFNQWFSAIIKRGLRIVISSHKLQKQTLWSFLSGVFKCRHDSSSTGPQGFRHLPKNRSILVLLSGHRYRIIAAAGSSPVSGTYVQPFFPLA